MEMANPLHRGVFCQFPLRWIYYYGSNKSTGKETGKTHLCALPTPNVLLWIQITYLLLMLINKVLNRYFLSAPSAPPVAIDAPESYLFTKAPEIL